MAFLPAFLAVAGPYLGAASAAGAIYEGASRSQADNYNAQVMKNEQKLSIEQATAQEGLVRKNSREQLGKQAAAFGGAGVGYGGSSETALDQSAVNQELDALNTRYRGTITGYGYGVQSDILKQEGRDELASGVLMAGGRALKNFGGSYTTVQSPSAMAGVSSPVTPSPYQSLA